GPAGPEPLAGSPDPDPFAGSAAPPPNASAAGAATPPKAEPASACPPSPGRVAEGVFLLRDGTAARPLQWGPWRGRRVEGPVAEPACRAPFRGDDWANSACSATWG